MEAPQLNLLFVAALSLLLLSIIWVQWRQTRRARQGEPQHTEDAERTRALQFMLDTTHAAIAMYNSAGRLIYANQTAKTLPQLLAIHSDIPPLDDLLESGSESDETRFEDEMGRPQHWFVRRQAVPGRDGLYLLLEAVDLHAVPPGMDASIDTPNRETLKGTATAQMPLPAPPSLPAVSLQGLKVLLVDDNGVVQQVSLEKLQQLDCEVTTLDDGNEVLKTLREQDFDVVLMDVLMPELGGRAVTQAIRAGKAGNGQRRIPIIGLAALSNNQERVACLADGMNAYLVKSASADTLAECIAQVTGLRLQRREMLSNESAPEVSPDEAASEPSGQAKEIEQIETVSRIPAETPEIATDGENQEAGGALDFDPDSVLELCENNKPLSLKLVRESLFYLEGYWQSLSKAIQGNSHGAAAFWAHTLRVQVGQAGGTRVAQMLTQLEPALKSGQSQAHLLTLLRALLDGYKLGAKAWMDNQK